MRVLVFILGCLVGAGALIGAEIGLNWDAAAWVGETLGKAQGTNNLTEAPTAAPGPAAAPTPSYQLTGGTVALHGAGLSDDAAATLTEPLGADVQDHLAPATGPDLEPEAVPHVAVRDDFAAFDAGGEGETQFGFAEQVTGGTDD